MRDEPGLDVVVRAVDRHLRRRRPAAVGRRRLEHDVLRAHRAAGDVAALRLDLQLAVGDGVAGRVLVEDRRPAAAVQRGAVERVVRVDARLALDRLVLLDVEVVEVDVAVVARVEADRDVVAPGAQDELVVERPVVGPRARVRQRELLHEVAVDVQAHPLGALERVRAVHVAERDVRLAVGERGHLERRARALVLVAADVAEAAVAGVLGLGVRAAGQRGRLGLVARRARRREPHGVEVDVAVVARDVLELDRVLARVERARCRGRAGRSATSRSTAA